MEYFFQFIYSFNTSVYITNQNARWDHNLLGQGNLHLFFMCEAIPKHKYVVYSNMAELIFVMVLPHPFLSPFIG